MGSHRDKNAASRAKNYHSHSRLNLNSLTRSLTLFALTNRRRILPSRPRTMPTFHNLNREERAVLQSGGTPNLRVILLSTALTKSLIASLRRLIEILIARL
ncbi:hypothetical protein NIES4071_55300 [Calothrix sp. NIES-4071]|nr:hypothetical protein NIES4071_55300 [Calothrix sp. NIES-4071]BAZ59837.1 hypothetical protein NIES4105_55250 [Calothrix sp. NIES-4105]